jgi:hypothetical protein
VREILSGTQIIQTVAGNGTQGAGGGGDGGPATNAVFGFPEGLNVDSSGNLYIADLTGLIRKVTAATGIIQTVAGDRLIAGFAGDGGPATSAKMLEPTGVFVDTSGNIFIADTGNGRIREVVFASGDIQTVAGNGKDGDSGDGGPATGAMFLNPTSVFVDNSGNIFIGDAGALREVLASTGNVQTVTASAQVGYSGDGGPATSAALFEPQGVAADGTGNIFIADTANHRIREVSSATGNIQTVAGNGAAPTAVGGGPATTIQVQPWDLAVDGFGNIVYSQRSFNVAAAYGGVPIIESATPISVEEVIAASNLAAILPLNAGSSSNLSRYPGGVFVDNSGNIFVVDDALLRVEEIVASSGLLRTVVGTGNGGFTPGGDGGLATSAALGIQPAGIFEDSSGNLFVSGENNIREVMARTGIIQTVAGSASGIAGFSGDGGPAASALLSNPTGVVVDSSGNIFIADSVNNRIREVVAATGQIETIVGTGVAGFSGDGGPANLAQLNQPTSLALDSSGNLIISDSLNSRIREVFLAAGPQATLSATVISFPAQIVATKSSTQSVTLTNSGNASLIITTVPSVGGTSSSDFTVAGGTTCAAGTVVLPNSSCIVNVSFTPGATGTRGPAILSISDNAQNTFPISLIGSGVDFSIGAQMGGSTSATITAGQTATFNLQMAATGFVGSVSLSCTGAPAAASCTVSPTSVSLNGTAAAPFVVSVTTTASSFIPVTLTSYDNPKRLASSLVLTVILGMLFMLGKIISSGLRPSLTLALTVILAGLWLSSCGGGKTAPQTPSVTGTPTGMSILTVTATSGTASRSTSLTMTVN